MRFMYLGERNVAFYIIHILCELAMLIASVVRL